MTFTLVATFRAVDAAAAERIQELIRNVRDLALSPDEPGTSVYIPTRSQADSLDFLVYEEYADKAALAAHMASAQFQALAAEADALFVGGKAGLKLEYYDRF
ncbi:hypothetical protein Q8F55_003336 [Vanrija albida]|uniref:ABM domain-containing protein n=1 Tax=Vanrija albida TaxID=181172 RepID=A0ABR3Q3R7_9TREE